MFGKRKKAASGPTRVLLCNLGSGPRHVLDADVAKYKRWYSHVDVAYVDTCSEPMALVG